MKLNFELVPDGCWYSNLRTHLKKSVWDLLRKDAYSRAGGKCMICSRPTKRLEAHEKWDYNEKTCVQSLVDIIAVCHACHSVIHIGRTQLMGEEDKAIKHFTMVNKCSYADYRKALGQANIDHQRRNKIEWQLDVTKIADIIGNADEIIKNLV